MGGAFQGDDFQVNEFRLNPSQLRFGLGRERFPALIEPKFASAEQAASWPWLPETARVLAVKIGEEVKVYPLLLLRRHEVVNDLVSGRPIFAAYCYLAELAAVYDRRIGQHTLTFAVSGYTYADRDVWEGRHAFVLWDRETESLWWPPIGRAVSGAWIDTSMPLLDRQFWSQTTWAQVKADHPGLVVLKPNQDLKRPRHWGKLTVQAGAPNSGTTPDEAVAPRWGQNSEL